VLAVFSVGIAWGWPFFSSAFPLPRPPNRAGLEHQLHHAQPVARAGRLRPGPRAPSRGPSSDLAPLPHSVRGRAAEFHHLAGKPGARRRRDRPGVRFPRLYYLPRASTPAEGGGPVFRASSAFLRHKWYFDELYSALIVRPALVVSEWCKTIDTGCIDWLIDNSARDHGARGEVGRPLRQTVSSTDW